MKKILEYKIIRYILAICVSILIFPLALIIESVIPALSGWMLLAFVIVLFYSLTWAQDYPDISALKFTNIKLLFFKGVRLVVSFYVYFGLLYIPYRFVVSGYEWLKFGSFSTKTTCNTTGWFCNNYTGWVGIDKILDWFGSNDVLVMLIIFLAFGAAVLLFIPDNSDDAVN
jgi:hypothetical protein